MLRHAMNFKEMSYMDRASLSSANSGLILVCFEALPEPRAIQCLKKGWTRESLEKTSSINYAWRYTFISPYVFIVWCSINYGGNCTFKTFVSDLRAVCNLYDFRFSQRWLGTVLFRAGFLRCSFFDLEDGCDIFLETLVDIQRTIHRYIPGDSTLQSVKLLEYYCSADCQVADRMLATPRSGGEQYLCIIPS
jgi:hypothetical protein